MFIGANEMSYISDSYARQSLILVRSFTSLTMILLRECFHCGHTFLVST